MQIQYVDGPRLRRSLLAACEYAQRQRRELNRINVFPVPDGDTGTNLALTAQAIADHLRINGDGEAGVVAREAAQAAVLGARGNCGMMLSHFLLGFAERVDGQDRLSTREFGAALDAGVQNLHAALEEPREGTILTVMRDTAAAAGDGEHLDFVPLVKHLVREARASLARTPDLLPVLARAGVVDAGAKGFVSLLEGVLLFIHGDPVVAPRNPGEGFSMEMPPEGSVPEAVGAGMLREAAAGAAEYDEEAYRYCTEALARGDALPSQAAAREHLRSMGDSLIVIRSGDILKVHIHTDEPEEVFSWLREHGRLVTHKAEDMEIQHAALGRSSRGHGVARRPLAVMSDSACDLPEEVVRAHGIHLTPLLLVGDERTYRDREDIRAEDFHELLRTQAPMPTTSQPSPADFLETFRRAAGDGEAVLGVLLSSTLSGTYSSARAAAGRFEDAPVELVDSVGLSLLQGLLVLKAAEMGELGESPEDIHAELRRIRAQSGIIFTVDTFDRLLASGRVSRGRALLGSLLSVKPILALNAEGVVEPVGKALGRTRARAALLDALAERIPTNTTVRFGVVHVGAGEIAEEVAQRLRDHWGRDTEVLVAPCTPVIATHLGIGAWGVAFMVED